MMAVDHNALRNAVLAAQASQEAATVALRAAVSPEQDLLLEALLDAVADHWTASHRQLAASLAGYLPGVGPAILELADMIEHRTQL